MVSIGKKSITVILNVQKKNYVCAPNNGAIDALLKWL